MTFKTVAKRCSLFLAGFLIKNHYPRFRGAPSHPLTLSPSHPLTLSPSHPLTLSPSHPFSTPLFSTPSVDSGLSGFISGLKICGGLYLWVLAYRVHIAKVLLVLRTYLFQCVKVLYHSRGSKESRIVRANCRGGRGPVKWRLLSKLVPKNQYYNDGLSDTAILDAKLKLGHYRRKPVTTSDSESYRNHRRIFLQIVVVVLG